MRRVAYAIWIGAHVEHRGYGQCREVCEAMQKVFPELELRFGFFHSGAWGSRQHFWLRDDAGIVDPTGEQHPDGDIFPMSEVQYEDLTDCSEEELTDKVPTGVCMDCGSPVYHGRTFCNEACEAATMAYLGMELNDNGRWHNV